MDNNIRKYIDIVTESNNVNISKIARYIQNTGEGYKFQKDINVSTYIYAKEHQVATSIKFDITYNKIEMLIKNNEVYFTAFYEFQDKELFDKHTAPINGEFAKILKRSIGNSLEHSIRQLIRDILPTLGFDLDYKKVNQSIGNSYNDLELKQVTCRIRWYNDFNEQLLRAIQYKQAMDEMS